MLSRRTLLVSGAGVAVTGVVGTGGWLAAPGGFRYRVRESLGLNPAPYVPDVAEGEIRIETMTSGAMGAVPIFTAVPAGHGDGAGLPVVVVLHGASATVEDFRGFGFGHFVTAAAEAGFPLVLAGPEDGPAGWVPSGSIDPQAMLRDELPVWLAERGFDVSRLGLWGWSRGGYGALRFAALEPTWARAMALFSPALHPGDAVLDDVDVLDALPTGLWCGESDAFLGGTRALATALPRQPEVMSTGDGGHTRQYWNDQTLPMLRWLGGHLA